MGELIVFYKLEYAFSANDPPEACLQTATDLYIEDITRKGLVAVGKVHASSQLRLFSKDIIDVEVKGIVRPLPKKVAV